MEQLVILQLLPFPSPPPPLMGCQSITRLPPDKLPWQFTCTHLYSCSLPVAIPFSPRWNASVSPCGGRVSYTYANTPGGREAVQKYIALPKNTTQWSSQQVNVNPLTQSPVHWPLGHCVSLDVFRIKTETGCGLNPGVKVDFVTWLTRWE